MSRFDTLLVTVTALFAIVVVVVLGLNCESTTNCARACAPAGLARFVEGGGPGLPAVCECVREAHP